MGACVSTSTAEDERNRQVENTLKEAKRTWDRHTKVLLLGTGDSGKSTVLKQMRVINSIPFKPAEIETYRQLIFANIVEGLRMLYTVIEEEGIECSEETVKAFSTIVDLPDIKDEEPYPVECQAMFEQVWSDSDVQKAVILGNQVGLPDNLPYYLDELSRLFKPDYKPTPQDIIHSRSRTIGVHEMRLTVKKQVMSLIDVGGQRSERRKWIHCFQEVTAILFLVSLSGYDQTLAEDHETNQMQDAMIVWESICSSPWFEHTSFILFLNKEDLFRQKVLNSSIKRHFPDYEGAEADATEGMNYFRRRFLRIHNKANQSFKNPTESKNSRRPKLPPLPTPVDIRKVYPYFTTATDTQMIGNIMNFVNDIILLDNLAGSSML